MQTNAVEYFTYEENCYVCPHEHPEAFLPVLSVEVNTGNPDPFANECSAEISTIYARNAATLNCLLAREPCLELFRHGPFLRPHAALQARRDKRTDLTIARCPGQGLPRFCRCFIPELAGERGVQQAVA